MTDDNPTDGGLFIPPIWLEQQYAEFVRPSPLLRSMFPPRPPLTRRQKLKRRIVGYGRRIQTAIEVLRGIDIHEGCT